MLLGLTKERKMRSKIRWFTEFCNSHYLSHFAAFFIDARAKRSVAESCIMHQIPFPSKQLHWCMCGSDKESPQIHFFCKAVLTTRGKPSEKVYARGAQIDGEMKNDRACTVKEKTSDNSSCYFNNDPSAGSPTETLLRLLLPLNDQVWSASQQ